MIRYLYSIGLMLGCMGLTLQAKGITDTPVQPAPAKSTKTVAKSTAVPSTPSPAESIKNSKTDTQSVVSNSSNEKAKPSVAKTYEKSTPSVCFNSQTRPSTVSSVRTHASVSSQSTEGGRLARLTAYWSGEGDYYTGRGMSSTGVHLHDGHCAVDPRIIPYGSVVSIAGLGNYLAVDTGSAVISREAARETGHTAEERNALVIDLFFESRRDGERFAASATKYAVITWSSPRSTASTAQLTAGLAAE